MGLVTLDLAFSLEKSFGIQLAKGWWFELLSSVEADDVSLGEVHEAILEECARQGVAPPAESWPTFVNCVVSTGVKRTEVLPETMFLRDVAPNG